MKRRTKSHRPDGAVKEKITITTFIRNANTEGGFTNVHWLSRAPGGSLWENIGFGTGNVQWSDMSRNYQFYRVYGLRIKYIPRIFG